LIFNTALALNPNIAEAYANRGSARGNLKDYKGALEDLNTAIELNPGMAEVYMNRGLAKLILGIRKGRGRTWTRRTDGRAVPEL